ncbi:transcription factor bHLH121 [Punica granatum]|uniref:Transcription factor bHLH121 n=1 Tax=Punica granatum TaxID=22663 RepID=A0A6P8DQC2_PUNGR|nr:transcription factor bHLH121 [Punica granatum]
MKPEIPPPPPRDPHAPPLGSPSQPNSSQRNENAARKTQKADREKLRRDRLNEQFVELGNALDPDRPKNDKATIIADTIQLLKDLTAEVNKLKTEYAALTEESRELTQEKNDLKDEKASLKSEIDNLNIQCQHRSRAMFPWGPMDPSVVMGPTGPASYPFPVPMAVPSGPIPMHPSIPPYTFFASPNPNIIPNSCSTFVPYITPSTQVEQLSAQYVSPLMQRGNASHVSSNVDNKNKSSGEGKSRKSDDSNEVTTDLELKTPWSTADHDSCSEQRKSKRSLTRDDSGERSASSRCSSSRSVQDSSSNSVVGESKADD